MIITKIIYLLTLMTWLINLSVSNVDTSIENPKSE